LAAIFILFVATIALPLSAAEIVLVAGGPSQVWAGQFSQSAGWTGTALSGSTSAGTAVKLGGPSSALGAIQSSSTGDVQYTAWNAGTWTPLTDLGVSAVGAPALASGNATTYLAYQGPSYYYFLGIYSSGWSAMNEPVGGSGGSQSYGLAPPALALLNGQPVVAFTDSADEISVQMQVSGAWAPSQVVSGSSPGSSVAPAVVATTANNSFDLVLVFTRSSDHALCYATHGNGVWSASSPIPNASSLDTPSIAALAQGDVVLAFSGTDGNAYFARLSSGTWSAVSPLGASPTAVASAPAVAPGIGAANVEAAFVSTSGAAYHTRLVSGVWTAPTLVGGTGLTHVAIDSNSTSTTQAPALGPWGLAALAGFLLLAGLASYRIRSRQQPSPYP
jgi:hypothetical protein